MKRKLGGSGKAACVPKLGNGIGFLWKGSLISNRYGLTLLELLLALGVLSVVLLAGGVMSISAGKVLHRVNAQTRAFDTANYILRYMEKDIKQMVPPAATTNQLTVSNTLCTQWSGTASLNFTSTLPNSFTYWGARYQYHLYDRTLYGPVGDWSVMSSGYQDMEVFPYAQADDFQNPVSEEDLRGCAENPCYKFTGTNFCPNLWDVVTDSSGNKTLIVRIGVRVKDNTGKTVATAGVRKYFELPKEET